jgi:hypothetical protein
VPSTEHKCFFAPTPFNTLRPAQQQPMSYSVQAPEIISTQLLTLATSSDRYRLCILRKR